MDIAELIQFLNYSSTEGKYFVFFRDRPPKKGGPGLVVGRRSKLGFETIVSDYFPVSEQGWAKAWETLAGMDRQEFERCRSTVLRNSTRFKLHSDDLQRRLEIDQKTRKLLGGSIYLGGHSPHVQLNENSAYDLRFTDDSLTILNVGSLRTLSSFPYRTFTNFQITGPGEISVRTTDSELFFLNTRTEPGRLRIDLSAVLGRINEVLNPAASGERAEPDPSAASIINQLKDASSLLERGLITPVEFEQLKSRLLSGG
ncbi:SHOCT domain-containing protein [Amycolatopsis sp. FBCC-B4732]|uniref:SHOCT domain-containing protein n=1 Tax=Amycolatopsis sp. FBCC-B4732 TaxID=3079339 RepID=UPI001FF1C7CF|nr:SHOCT domain-containing protein [Amycolatopsis sp. FBCC-B4732]UOX87892.1 SHOCT domain-containing protein [Amycolatopsis sp. FBCC-B4732]